MVITRLIIVSHEAKKKQQYATAACMSELFTHNTTQKFVNTSSYCIAKPPLKLSLIAN